MTVTLICFAPFLCWLLYKGGKATLVYYRKHRSKRILDEMTAEAQLFGLYDDE